MQGLDLHGLRGVWFEVYVVVQRHCRRAIRGPELENIMVVGICAHM